MNRVLGIILVVQIALVAALYWPAAEGPAPRTALLSGMTREAVTTIAVTERDVQSATLTRSAQGWVLESGLPADDAKVATLLSALLEQDPGYAIARSPSAAARFEVSSDGFDRRIVLSGGEQQATAFLGSSPAFRKVHARRDGEDEVYILALNSYDAPATEETWLDRSLLSQTGINRLVMYGVTFALEDDGWRRDDGAEVDGEAMETLIQALASLQVSGLVGEDDEDAAAAGETLRLDIGKAGGSLRLTVLDNPESERFYLQSDRYPVLFDTSAYDAQRLVDAANELLGVEESMTESESETESELESESETETETETETESESESDDEAGL